MNKHRSERRPKSKQTDPLVLLGRTDKWYLGGGGRLLWAPLFPTHLDTPGFWDKAQYFNYELQPLFTWTLLDEKGEEIPLQCISRNWNPAKLSSAFSTHPAGRKLQFLEEKTILPNDIACSTIRLRNLSRRKATVHLVFWTVQESNVPGTDVWIFEPEYHEGAITYERHIKPEGKPELCLSAILKLSRPPSSFEIQLAERTAMLPEWPHSPFFESFNGGRLANRSNVSGDDPGNFTVSESLSHVPPSRERTRSAFASPSRYDRPARPSAVT